MSQKYLYTGEKTDDDPLIWIQIARSFLPYLLGACEDLAHPGTWTVDSDANEAVFQSLDAKVRLLGAEEQPVIGYSWHTWLDFLAVDVLTAGGYTFAVNTAQMHNEVFNNTIPVLNEDALQFTLALGAGGYQLALYGTKGGNRGKFRWVIDDDDLIGQDMDLYAAAGVFNAGFGVTFDLVSSGEHTFKLRNVGKNVSRSNYSFSVTCFVVNRLS
jgi:hypothetical protein